MITNKEAIKLLKQQPAKFSPEYREPICADCGRAVRKAWHIRCKDFWVQKEILLCVDCGKKYGVEDA